MRSWFATLAILGMCASCADDVALSYRRESGAVVEVGPCADGDILCLDVVDAIVDLSGPEVSRLEIVALLRGPFNEGTAYAFDGASIVVPEYRGADDSYGLLTRYPLDLQFLPGEEVWQHGRLTHLVNSATDARTLSAMCGQVVIAEITLGAASDVTRGVTSSTAWLDGVTIQCRD